VLIASAEKQIDGEVTANKNESLVKIFFKMHNVLLLFII